MIDLHSHILPEMDDGSADVQESLWLLDALAQQGVTHVAATSHFYATREYPEDFLRRRAQSAARLAPMLTSDHPAIRLGAEVHYFESISGVSGLERLCIEGTPLFLLEMPYGKWTARIVDDVLELCNKPELTVVMAHIERYYAHQPRLVWDMLEQEGALFQVNAQSVLSWFGSGRVLRLIREGRAHFLGSDCHNKTNRPPCLAKARERIARNLGQEALWKLDDIQNKWFSGSEVPVG